MCRGPALNCWNITAVHQPGADVNNGYFITGTDTDAGKTVVTAALLSKFLSAGIDAVPMKPVQTGCPRDDNGYWGNLDLDLCFKLTGFDPHPEELQLMGPYKFGPACSPHLAARLAGVKIDLQNICKAAEQLAARHQTILIEGAGGVLVPINEQETMLDLMRKLELPVIVATRPGLGTINHTLLTLNELRRGGLDIEGVVFCETCPTEWGTIERDNWGTIERLGETKILGCIPYLPTLAGGVWEPRFFPDVVEENIALP